MKNLNKIMVTTLITGGLIGTAFITHAGNRDHNESTSIALSEASIGMSKAVEIALATIPGTPMEAEFEVEDGQSIWEVEVLDTNKQVYELEIDATSGEVLKQELENHKHRKHKRNKKHEY